MTTERPIPAQYLFHEGACCIPEYAGALVSLGNAFRVRTGRFGQERLWREVDADCRGAAAANVFKPLRFGVIGNTTPGAFSDGLRVTNSVGRAPPKTAFPRMAPCSYARDI